MRPVRAGTLIGGFLLMVTLFQNCAVYRSGDRKLLEERGYPRVSRSTASATKTGADVCTKMTIEARELYGEDGFDAREVEAGEWARERRACLISARTESMDGSDTALCGFLQKPLEADQLDKSDESNSSTLERGLRVLETGHGTDAKLIIATEASQVAACVFVYDSDESRGLGRDRAIEQAARLLQSVSSP